MTDTLTTTESHRFTHPLFSAATVIAFAILVVASSTMAGAEDPRISVRSAGLEVTPKGLWPRELGYRSTEIRALTIAPATGCPLVQVEIGGVPASLILDTGTARGFMITDRAPRVPFHELRRVQETQADGTLRGESMEIRVDSIEVFGRRFSDVEGTRADWRMYSSAPFTGTIGLDFFRERRLTLDYASRTAAAAVSPLPDSLDPKRYLVLDLIDAPEGQGQLLYVRAVVNGQAAIVYLDTGYSASWIDPAFAQGLERSERPGGAGALRRGATLELGGHTLVLDDLRQEAIRRGAGLDRPVALALGSDFLSRFVVTIDLREKKLVLARAR